MHQQHSAAPVPKVISQGFNAKRNIIDITYMYPVLIYRAYTYVHCQSFRQSQLPRQRFPQGTTLINITSDDSFAIDRKMRGGRERRVRERDRERERKREAPIAELRRCGDRIRGGVSISVAGR